MASKIDQLKIEKIIFEQHIIEKIPFFRGLLPHQARQLLKIGQVKKFLKSQALCHDGDSSTAMYILLSGEMAVKEDNTELARLKPVDIVGEMGVVTGLPRCATIEVVEEATVMVIGRIEFEALLKTDAKMSSQIYKNMLDSLCRKLRENNVQLLRSKASREIVASSI